MGTGASPKAMGASPEPMAASPQAPTAMGSGPLEVLHAETVHYDAEKKRVTASGNVTLRRDGVTLRARTVTYDPDTGEADASGGVLLSEPGRVMAADAMHLVMGGQFEAKDVTAFYKDKPLALEKVESLDAARHLGRNRLTLTGARVSGLEGQRELSIDWARISLCDCEKGPPSWEIRAAHADVIPGKRAILTWPVLYVTPRFLFIDAQIPVFAAPWLYLPLGERQTGLLMPVIDSSPTTRLILAQPIFFDLGRSWDATLTPQYLTGESDKDVKKPVGAKRSVAGLGADLELRWAPAPNVYGQLELRYLHDQGHSFSGEQRSPDRGDRVALTLSHGQRFSAASRLRVELGLATDPEFPTDFTVDTLLRATEYSRSSVTWTYRFDEALVEADASYLLPLQYFGPSRDFPTDPVTQVPRFSYGVFGANVPVFHRLPATSAFLLPQRLVGPIFLSGSLGLARFAPIKGSTGDEGASGAGPGERLWPGPLPPGQELPSDRIGQLDGRWEPGERLAAVRQTVRMELRAPFSLDKVLSVEPWLRGTAAAYEFQVAHAPLGNAWAVGGLTLSTLLSRTYGAAGGKLRHDVLPRIEWRGGTGVAGAGLPAYAYDELDVAPEVGQPRMPNSTLPIRPLSALPGGSFDQLRVAVRNRLVRPGGPMAELELGQDFDLKAGARSESFVNGSCTIGPVSAGATSRFRAFGAPVPEGTPPLTSKQTPSWMDRFTLLAAHLNVADSRGDNLHSGFLSVASGGSPQLKAGLEPLFDRRPAFPQVVGNASLLPVAQATVGLQVKLDSLTATYDLNFVPRRDVTGFSGLDTQTINLNWDSPCHCWRAGVGLTISRDGSILPRFLFDLSSGLSGASFQ